MLSFSGLADPDADPKDVAPWKEAEGAEAGNAALAVLFLFW